MPGNLTYNQIYQGAAVNKPGLTQEQFASDMANPQNSYKLYTNMKAGNPSSVPENYKDFVALLQEGQKQPTQQAPEQGKPFGVTSVPLLYEDVEKQKKIDFANHQGIMRNGKPIYSDTNKQDQFIHDSKTDYFINSLIENPNVPGQPSISDKDPGQLPENINFNDPSGINTVTAKIHQYFENELSKSSAQPDESKKIDQTDAQLIKEIQQTIPGWKPTITPQEWKLYNDNSDYLYGTIGSEINSLEKQQPSLIGGALLDIKNTLTGISNLMEPGGFALNIASQQATPQDKLEQYKQLKNTYAKLWLLGQKPTDQQLGTWGAFWDNIKAGLSMDNYQTKDQFIQNRDNLLKQSISNDIVTKNPGITLKDLTDETNRQVKQLTTPQQGNVLDPSWERILAVNGGNMVGSLPYYMATSAVGGEVAGISNWTTRLAESDNAIVRLSGKFASSTLRNAIPMAMLSKDKLSGLMAGYAFGAASNVASKIGAVIDGASYGGAMKVIAKTAATAAVHGVSSAGAVAGMKAAATILGQSDDFNNDLKDKGLDGVLSDNGKEFLANAILYSILPLAGIHEEFRATNGLKIAFDRDVAQAPEKLQKPLEEIKGDAEQVLSKEPAPAIEPILKTSKDNPNPPSAPIVAEANGPESKYTVPLGNNESVVNQSDFKGTTGDIIVNGDKIHTIEGDNSKAILELRHKQLKGEQLNPQELEDLAGLTGQDKGAVLRDIADKARADGNSQFANQVTSHIEQMELNELGTAHENNIKALIKKFIYTKQRNVPSNEEVTAARAALVKYAATNGYNTSFDNNDNVTASKGDKVIDETSSDFARSKAAAADLQKMITSQSKIDIDKRNPDKELKILQVATAQGLKPSLDEKGRIILTDGLGNAVMRPDNVYKGIKDYDEETRRKAVSVLQKMIDTPVDIKDMKAADVQKAAESIRSKESNYYTEKFMDLMEGDAEVTGHGKPIPKEPVKLVNDNDPLVKDEDMAEFLKNPVVPEPKKEETEKAIEDINFDDEVKTEEVKQEAKGKKTTKKDISKARKEKNPGKVKDLNKKAKKYTASQKAYIDKVKEMQKQGLEIDPDARYIKNPETGGKMKNPLWELDKAIIEEDKDRPEIPVREGTTEVSPLYSPLYQGAKSGSFDDALNRAGLGEYAGNKLETVTYALRKKGLINLSEENAINRANEERAVKEVKTTKNKGRTAGRLSATILPFLPPESEGEGLINKGIHAAIDAYNKKTKFKDFVKNVWAAAAKTPEEEEQIKKYRADLKFGRMLQYTFDAIGAYHEGRFSKFTGIDRMGAEDYEPGEEHIIEANNKYRGAIVNAWDVSKGEPEAFKKYIFNAGVKLLAEAKDTPTEKAALFISSKMINLSGNIRNSADVNKAVEMVTNSIRYRYGDQITSPSYLHEQEVLDAISKQPFEPLNNEEYDKLYKAVYGDSKDPYSLKPENRVAKRTAIGKIGEYIDDFYRHPQFLYAIAKTEAGKNIQKNLYNETQKGMVFIPHTLQYEWTNEFKNITESLDNKQGTNLARILHLGKYWDEKEYTPEELKKGIELPDKSKIEPDDKTIEAYGNFRDLIHKIQDKIIAGERFKRQVVSVPDKDSETGFTEKELYPHEMDAAQQKSWEEQKRKDLFGVNGYTPFERNRNDNHIVVGTGQDYLYKAGGVRKHVFKVDNADKAELLANHLRAQGFTNVSAFEKSSIPRASLNDINITDLNSIKDAIQKGREESDLSEVDRQAVKRIDEAIRDVHVLRGRGNKLQFKAVPGVDPTFDNLVYSMNNMINREALSYGNGYAKYKQEGLMAQFPQQDNALQSRSKEWIASINKKGISSGLYEKLSTLTYAYRLMLNPTHIGRVFAGTFYMTPMALHLEQSPLIYGKEGSYAAKHMRGLAYAMQFTRDKQGTISKLFEKEPFKGVNILDPKTIKNTATYDLMEQLHNGGVFTHNSSTHVQNMMYNRAAREAGKGSFVLKGLDKLLDKGVHYWNVAQNQSVANIEYFARALTGYMGIKDAQARGIKDPEKILDHARSLVFRVNANYDKTNRTLIQSKAVNSVLLRGITNSMLLFKNTHMNHNELMTDVLGDMGKQIMGGNFLGKAMARGLGALAYEGIGEGLTNFLNPINLGLKMGNAVSTGLQKAPLTTASMMAASAMLYHHFLHKDDEPDLTIDEKLHKAFNGHDELADIFSHGFYAGVGLESGNINDLGNISIGGNGNILDAMPATAMVHRWYQGITAIEEHDKHQIYKDYAPSFLENVDKSQEWRDNPLQISKGVIYQNNKTRELEMLCGLQPLSYSKAYDANRLEQAFKQSHDQIIQRINNTGEFSITELNQWNEDMKDRLWTAYEQSGATINKYQLGKLINSLMITPYKIEKERLLHPPKK